MPEQPPKFICEICGGAHPTTEHGTNAKEPSEERDYRSIEGIRFEEGVPEETVRAFLELIKTEEEQFRIQHHRKNADPDCYAEHILWRGSNVSAIRKGKEITIPILRKPLTPYGLLSEYYSVEEILKERQRGKNFVASFDYFFKKDCDVGLAISGEDQEKFFDFIKNHAAGTPNKYVDYFFEPMAFDADAGNLELPFLKAVGFSYPSKYTSEHKTVDLPAELKHKIKVKELRDRNLMERFNTPVMIDQSGWRLDAKK